MIKNEIKLSQGFKAHTRKAIMAILLFVLVFLLVTFAALALTAVCAYFGLMLVIAAPHLFTIVLGIGLASMGFLILIFLFKFLFASKKVDRSNLIEIRKKDEPALFELIEEVVNEVGTKFPKRVYLSAEVNAAVFYDSNFWSMILPIKKNLLIGVGLVNSVTVDELRAILAHEFGHFSQRTMKVGSYVYNVNQVIFNMLFDNDAYGDLLNRWAGVSWLFYIFVVVAVKINEGIQWLLRKVYGIVNLSYLGLSREMEFHADEIAAHVAGSDSLKTSLLRLDLAEHSYKAVLEFYGKRVTQNEISDNIYKEQAFVMNFYAKHDKIPVQYGLPDVSLDIVKKFNRSKLVIKDQWASHPSTPERVTVLTKLNLPRRNNNNKPANTVFKDTIQTQKALTQKLFDAVTYKETPEVNDFAFFAHSFEYEFYGNQYDGKYNDYYVNWMVKAFDLEVAVEGMEGLDTIGLAALYTGEMVELVNAAYALEADLETISKIAKKEYPMKSFDYDGLKYDQKESQRLANRLNVQLREKITAIQNHDLQVFRFFKQQETLQNKPPQLVDRYRDYFNFEAQLAENLSCFFELQNALGFMHHETTIDEIKLNFRHVHHIEVKFKEMIVDLIENDAIRSFIPKMTVEFFQEYCSKKWQYFYNQNYRQDNLAVLYRAMEEYYGLLPLAFQQYKRGLLDYQVSLIEK